MRREFAGNIMKFSSEFDKETWIVVKLDKRHTLKMNCVYEYAPTFQISDEEIMLHYAPPVRILVVLLTTVSCSLGKGF